MIRYSPIGIVLAIVFILLGPHDWFVSPNRSAHIQASPSALSTVLPDVNSVGDQPRRGMVDAVQTKQGWVVRTASGLTLRYELFVGAMLLIFGWPLRKFLISRQQDRSTSDHDEEG